MSSCPVSAHAVGKFAWNLLAETQVAQPLGITKRGAFFRLACGQVIFLSTEAFRGPLTINVRFPSDRLGKVLQTEACFSQENIQFMGVEWSIDLRPAQVWETGAPVLSQVLSAESREQNITHVIGYFVGRENLSDLARLLPHLMKEKFPDGMQANPFRLLLSRVKEFAREDTWDDFQIARLAQALGEFLGLGPGLTPSGDDFVTGFILALNRWSVVLHLGMQMDPLNQALMNLALKKTTALSASLIACAVLGQADERLVRAFDGIMLGEPDPAACADLLSGWGSSSGLDALAGFIIGHLIGGKHGEG